MRIKMICIMMLLSVTVAFCQRASIRHVKGIRSVDLGYGVANYGSLYHAGYVMYFSNRLYGKGKGYYLQMEDSGIKLKSYGVDVYAAYNFLTLKEIVFFNVTGGITAASYSPSGEISGNLELPSQLKYGLLGGIDTEIFLNDRFVLFLTYNSKLMSKKEIYGSIKWFVEAGIRYNF